MAEAYQIKDQEISSLHLNFNGSEKSLRLEEFMSFWLGPKERKGQVAAKTRVYNYSPALSFVALMQKRNKKDQGGIKFLTQNEPLLG